MVVEEEVEEAVGDLEEEDLVEEVVLEEEDEEEDVENERSSCQFVMIVCHDKEQNRNIRSACEVKYVMFDLIKMDFKTFHMPKYLLYY